MKVFKCRSILLISCLLFIGCAPSYNITPEYDEKTKSVKIDNIKLENVYFYNKKNITPDNAMGNIFSYRENYKINDNDCSWLIVNQGDTKNNWHWNESMLETAMTLYRGHCKVEKIANLEFLQCEKNENITNKNVVYSNKIIDYAITSSTPNKGGYSKKTGIDMPEKCYEKFKKYFEENTK